VSRIHFNRLGILCGVLLAVNGRAAVEIYDFPKTAPLADDFIVTANGQPVFVYDTKVAAVASFGLSGKAEVRVRPRAGFHEAVIRPLSKGIKPTITHGEIVFTLDAPMQLSLELDGNIARPLFIFVNPPEQRPDRLDAPNLKYFAPGKIYHAGEIQLTDGQTLYLAGGAIVQGYVRAENAGNIRILGPGILDFSYEQNQGHSMIALKQCRNVEVRDLLLVDAWGWTFHLFQSAGILVDNLKEVAWRRNSDGIDIDASRRVNIKHCFLHNGDDCVVLKCTRANDDFRTTEDIVVRDCVIWNDTTGGNGLEIGYELRGEAVRNVTFRNCDLIHILSGAAISIHNGDYATVENIRYENIRVEDAHRAFVEFRIGLSRYSSDHPKQANRRPGVVPTGMADGPWISPPDKSVYAAKRGVIRNVAFKEVQFTGLDFPPITLIGYDDSHGISDVSFQGIALNGQPVAAWPPGKMKMQHASKVRF